MENTNERRGRLNSWKEIAEYLKRDVRTVARWEQRGLPVHRVPGGKRKVVFAYPDEIDRWIDSPQSRAPEASNSANSRKASLVIPALATFILIVAVALAYSFSHRGNIPTVTKVIQLTDDGYQKAAEATDGKTVYISRVVGHEFLFTALPAHGGAPRSIPVPFDNGIVEDISSDGKYLLADPYYGAMHVENPLWIVATKDGSAHPLKGIRSHSATWSPDAGMIAYASGTVIHVLHTNNGVDEKIASLTAVPTALRWSPKGNRIVFSARDAKSELSPWEISISRDGSFSSPHSLPLRMETPCCFQWAWTAKGKYLLFTSQRVPQGDREDNNRLWIVKDGQETNTDPVELQTSLKAVHWIAADPSSNSVFVSGGGNERSELFRFDSQAKVFAPSLPGLSAIYVDYSADGKSIAYVDASDGTLWRSRKDGSSRLRLTSPPMYAMLPRWSPDGKTIAFTAKIPEKPWQVFLIPEAGGPARTALDTLDNQGAPTWSPDGRQLMYANFLCEESGNCAIWVVDLQTHQIKKLPGSDGLRTARLSPNGKYVAALDPLRLRLMHYSFATRRWTIIGQNISGDDISWSQNSRWIYADRIFGTSLAILRFSVIAGSESASELVANVEPIHGMTGTLLSWFGLDRANVPVMARLAQSREIYRIDWQLK